MKPKFREGNRCFSLGENTGMLHGSDRSKGNKGRKEKPSDAKRGKP
jgi:hypothetical protein